MLNQTKPTLFHTHQYLKIYKTKNVNDFNLNFAYKTIAKTHTMTKNAKKTTHYGTINLEQTAAIANLNERKILLNDLATLP